MKIKQELPKPHKDYLDHLIRDMFDPNLSPVKKEGIEDMYLIRMIRLDRMGFNTIEYSNWYSHYMRQNDYIKNREKDEYREKNN